MESAFGVAAATTLLTIAVTYVTSSLFFRKKSKSSPYQEAIDDGEEPDKVFVLNAGAQSVQLMGQLDDIGADERCPHVGLAILKDRVRWRPRLRALVLSSINEYMIEDLANVTTSLTDPHVLVLFAFVRPKASCFGCCTKKRILYRTRLRFSDLQDLESAKKSLIRLMRGDVCSSGHSSTKSTAADSGSESQMREVLMILNPVSGLKRSSQLATEFLQLIEAASPRGIRHPQTDEPLMLRVQETKGPRHAFEIAQQLDPKKTAAIVAVGGDGILHEIVNGLVCSPQLGDNDRRKIPILPIAAGTGNGFAMALGIPPYDVESAALVFLRGRIGPYDTIRVETLNENGTRNLTEAAQRENAFGETPQPGHVVHCISFISCGIVSDTDRDSDHLRWMGSLRFTVMALWKVLKGSTVRAQLMYRLAEPSPSGSGEKAAQMVAVKEEVFSEACFMNIPFVSHDIMFGRYAKIDDGQVDMSLLPASVSRIGILKIFLLAESGAHLSRVNSDDSGHGTQYWKCSEVIITPQHSGDIAREASAHSYDVDGEFRPSSRPLRLTSHAHHIRVFR